MMTQHSKYTSGLNTRVAPNFSSEQPDDFWHRIDRMQVIKTISISLDEAFHETLDAALHRYVQEVNSYHGPTLQLEISREISYLDTVTYDLQHAMMVFLKFREHVNLALIANDIFPASLDDFRLMLRQGYTCLPCFLAEYIEENRFSDALEDPFLPKDDSPDDLFFCDLECEIEKYKNMVNEKIPYITQGVIENISDYFFSGTIMQETISKIHEGLERIENMADNIDKTAYTARMVMISVTALCTAASIVLAILYARRVFQQKSSKINQKDVLLANAAGDKIVAALNAEIPKVEEANAAAAIMMESLDSLEISTQGIAEPLEDVKSIWAHIHRILGVDDIGITEAAFLNRINMASRAVDSSEKLADSCMKLVQWILDTLHTHFFLDERWTLSYLLSDKLKDYATYISFLATLAARDAWETAPLSLIEEEIAMPGKRVVDQRFAVVSYVHHELQALLLTKKLEKGGDSTTIRYWLPVLKSYMNILGSKAESTSALRVAPSVVFMTGKPGTGKSSAVTALAFQFMRSYTKSNIQFRDFEANYSNYVYTPNFAQDHWDGFKKQPIIFIDDVGQMNDAATKVRENACLISLINTAPFRVPQASLHDKDHNEIAEPVLVIITGNNPTFFRDVVHAPGAITRRLKLCLEVTLSNPGVFHEDNWAFKTFTYQDQYKTISGDTLTFGGVVQDLLRQRGMESNLFSQYAKFLAKSNALPSSIDRFDLKRIDVIAQGGEDEKFEIIATPKELVGLINVTLPYDEKKYQKALNRGKGDLQQRALRAYAEAILPDKLSPTTPSTIVLTKVREWRKAIAAVAAIITAGAGVYALFRGFSGTSTKTQYDQQKTAGSNNSTRNSTKGVYIGSRPRTKMLDVSTQSGKDPTRTMLRLVKNATFIVSAGGVDCGSALLLGNHCLLVPVHIIQGARIRAKEAQEPVQFISAMDVAYNLDWDDGDMVWKSDGEIAVFYNPKLPCGRDMIKFFKNESDIKDVKVWPSSELVLYDPIDMVAHSASYSMMIDAPFQVDSFDLKGNRSKRTIDRTIIYGCLTYNGDCGSILISQDNAHQSRKLLGFHLAASTTTTAGIGTTITQEMLRKLVPIQTVTQGLPRALFASKERELVKRDWKPPTYVGKLEKPLNRNVKTKIRKTLLWAIDSQVRPSQMGSFTVEGMVYDPLHTAIAQYLRDDETYPDDRCFAKAIMWTKNRLTRVLKRFEDLTIEQATFGVPGMLDPIKPDGGVGYPWVYDFKQRKDLVDPETRFIHPKLRQAVEDLIVDPNAVEVVFLDFLKDETRKHEKVDAGKTRLISSSPLHYTIAVRMKYGGLMAQLQKLGMNVGIYAGFDPVTYGDVMGRMFEALKCGAGDIAGFDTSQNKRLMEAVFTIFKCFKNDEVAWALVKLCIGSTHVVGDMKYIWPQNLSSGMPLTLLWNSVCVLFAYAYSFARAGLSEKDFLDAVLAVMGDDNAHALTDKVAEKLSMFDLKTYFLELGLTLTNADKSELTPSTERTTAEGLSFLKRNLRYDEDYLCWMMPLELPSMWKAVEWTKTKESDAVYLAKALDLFERELSLHSQDVYDEQIKKMEKRISTTSFNHFFVRDRDVVLATLGYIRCVDFDTDPNEVAEAIIPNPRIRPFGKIDFFGDDVETQGDTPLGGEVIADPLSAPEDTAPGQPSMILFEDAGDVTTTARERTLRPVTSVQMIDNTLTEYMARPHLLSSGTVTAGDAVGHILSSGPLPSTFMNTNRVIQRIAALYGWRAAVQFTLVVNAMPYQCGVLGASLIPQNLLYKTSTLNIVQLTSAMIAGTLNYGAGQTRLVLQHPYTNVYTFTQNRWLAGATLSLPADGYSDDVCNYALYEITPLTVAAGQPNTIDYSIYISLIDFEPLGAAAAMQGVEAGTAMQRERNFRRICNLSSSDYSELTDIGYHGVAKIMRSHFPNFYELTGQSPSDVLPTISNIELYMRICVEYALFERKINRLSGLQYYKASFKHLKAMRVRYGDDMAFAVNQDLKGLDLPEPNALLSQLELPKLELIVRPPICYVHKKDEKTGVRTIVMRGLYTEGDRPFRPPMSDASLQIGHGSISALSSVTTQGPAGSSGKMANEREKGKSGVVSTTLGKLSDTAGKLGKLGIPVISEFTGIASFAADTLAGIASIWGFSAPPVQEAVRPMALVARHTMANSDHFKMYQNLSAFRDSYVSTEQTMFHDNLDPLSFDYLCSKPTYLGSFTISTSDSADARVYRLNLTPTNYGSTQVNNNNTGTSYTTLGYILSLASLARYNATIHLQFAGTKFHAGRYMAVFTPNTLASTGAANAAAADGLYRYICDIRDGVDCEFELPWISNFKMLQTDGVTWGGGIIPSTLGEFSVICINPLVAGGTVPTTITVNVYLGGKNIQVAGMRYPTTAPTYTSGQSTSPWPTITQGPQDFGCSANDQTEASYGSSEVIRSFRTMLKTHTPWSPQLSIAANPATNASTVNWAIINPWQVHAERENYSSGFTLDNSMLTQDIFSNIMALFATWKGGIRLSFVTDSTTAKLAFQYPSMDPGNNSDIKVRLITGSSSHCYPGGYTHTSLPNESGTEVNLPFISGLNAAFTHATAGKSSNNFSANGVLAYNNRLAVTNQDAANAATFFITRAAADDFQVGLFACVPFSRPANAYTGYRTYSTPNGVGDNSDW